MNITESLLNFLEKMIMKLTVSCTYAGLMSPAGEQMSGGTLAGVKLVLHKQTILDVA